MAALTQQVEADGARGRRRSRTPALAAVGLAAATVAAFAATGGLSYAASAVDGATQSVAHTFSGSNQTAGGSGVTPADQEYGSAGYYCFYSPTAHPTYEEELIASQADYESYVSQGYSGIRFDGSQKLPCNSSHT